MLMIVLLGVMVSAKSMETLRKFPNVKCLGRGYNVVTGNPESKEMTDPGSTYSVLKFDWSHNATTSDGKYLVPNHVQALQTVSCGFDSESSMVFGASSYQKALSVGVSVAAGGGYANWNARFSVNTTIDTVRGGMKEHRYFYSTAKAECVFYRLSLNIQYAPIGVTSEFAQAVSKLPLTRDDKAYEQFIKRYGTHFTSEVLMGAKMIVRSEFQENAMSTIDEAKLDVEVGAKVSFRKMFGGGVSVETKTEKKNRQSFEKIRNRETKIYFGSEPPLDGDWKTWAQKTSNEPTYAVEFKLFPLTALFTEKYFPNSSINDTVSKRSLLESAYDIYCKNLFGCGTPPPDRKPVRMKKMVSSFKTDVYVRCPPTYKMLSCGIENINTTVFDRQRHAIPHERHSCKCLDTFGAKCVAWCTNIDGNYTTVAKDKTTNTQNPDVSCPEGYKV